MPDPAVTRGAKLVFINAPTRNSEKSRQFYGALLGAEFAHGFNPNVAGWWTPMGHGVDFNITARYDDRERLTPYFAVDDLDSEIKRLEGMGGRCVVDPRDVVLGPEEARKFYETQLREEKVEYNPGEMKTVARMAVVLDPDLNHVGLMQVQPFARGHYRLAEPTSMRPEEGPVARPADERGGFAATKKLADELERAGALPSI